MNTTSTAVPTPAAEVPLNRAAKEALLRQMYSRAHWIDLIRLVGYQTIPMERAREAIQPLAKQYGKECVATASEILVEIITRDHQTFARLKPHVRRMAFQILGPEPSQNAAAPSGTVTASEIDQPAETEQPRGVGAKKTKKPTKAPALAQDAIPPSTGSGDALMQQYRAAKEKHPGMLLLFRMGDFIELFGQDAETAHKLLGLTLTTRDRTLVMAGFPHHQLEVYLHKLLKEGQRVAICEPVEDSLARGPIQREVTRVVTSENGQESDRKDGPPKVQVPKNDGDGVRQPRHFVLKQFEAWMKEASLAFVPIKDARRTTPAVAAYVGVLDFIVMRGEEKLLVTVRPQLLAKHLTAIRELQNLFGSEYKPMRMWPSEGPDGWSWHDYAVDLSAKDSAPDTERKPRRKRSPANAPQ